MSIKVELGNKIRKLREEQSLSRGELCEGEEELTVRQLARIEAGESLPTLLKLEFIADRLSVSVSLLVDRKYVELPKRYLQLKHKLYKSYTYNDDERILKKEQYFAEIYEEYYAILPEEEQLSIDVQQATMDVHLAERADFGEGLLQDYLSQIIRKTDYSANDLLVINLYFHCIYYKEYDEKVFIDLFNNVVKQVNTMIDFELFLLINLMMSAVGVFIKSNTYEKLLDAVKVCTIVMEINQDYQKKPVIDMVEGKYWLFSQRDIEKSRQKYIDGAQCAKLFGDQVLSEKILAEWVQDLQEFQRCQ